jgi:hypothetical protein
MPFYKVRCESNLKECPCGPHPDAEAAIMHFNRQYGVKIGKMFTTDAATKISCREYILIEQQRGEFGLYDVDAVPLYTKTI